MLTSLPGRARFLRRAALTGAVGVLLAATACSSDGASAPRSTTTSTTAGTVSTLPGTAATPQPTLAAAVSALLSAEQRADHATSYRLLSGAARKDFPDPADWRRRLGELPAVTGFTLEAGGSATKVVAVVRHEPGLDPFVGLSPARERQTWTGAREGGGWLVAGLPEVRPLLPPEAGARSAAVAWATAVQACDQAKAHAVEAVDEIFGTSDGASRLCRSTGAVAPGAVGRLEAGPASAALVAQYSTDVLSWARVVPLSGPVPTFSVILAPIGEMWKVVAVAD